MSIQWPSTLQDYLNQAGWSEEEGNTVITSEMDIGPAKKRRRFTKGIDKMSCSIDVKKDEYITFRSFFNTTLNGGVSYFEFNHPITGELEEWRFDGTPKYTPIGGLWFKIDMKWEKRP